jgi:hypothetical protein
MKKLIVVCLFACSSDSSSGGVDASLQLTDLTAAEVTQECTFLVSHFQPKSADCGGGLTVTVNNQTEAQCEAMINAVPDGCTATVGDSEDCLAAFEADPCNGGDSTACMALFAASCM